MNRTQILDPVRPAGRPLRPGPRRPISIDVNEQVAWWKTWKYAAGLLGCLVLGWFGFVRGVRVPLLALVDLGFHELGHFVTYVLSDIVTAMMGSIAQVLVPLGLAAYFLVMRRDVLGGGVCLAWAATSAQNASVYIADAPYQQLELIGGQHDWAFVLGLEHFDMLDRAHTIAAVVKGFGWVLLLAGIALCAVGPFVGRTRTRRVAPTTTLEPVSHAEMWR